ncbi:MAG: metal ABC transporter permease [Hyphomicrobiaceae bacterium]|nr:metal ABC transporter permease [Hyphomicrobiaceae bacterium]
MIETFVLKAFLAASALALVAAPLGAVVVWSRMAYFGEAVAHAGLLGVAIGLALRTDQTLAVLGVTLAVAGLVHLMSRQRLVPVDSVLGILHHGSLSLGIVLASMIAGPGLDLQAYLFGDIFAVTTADLLSLAALVVVVGAAMAWMWPDLVRIALDADLAAAEGVARERVRAAFVVLLALTVAVAVKFVGILLVIAFLVVPAVAARPLAATPEAMVAIAAGVGIAAVAAGLGLSLTLDVPGGPAIVLAMVTAAAASLLWAGVRERG